MASILRRIPALIALALPAVFNARRLDLLKLKAGSIYHADASAAIATADASDLATSVTLANALKASYNAHCASACSATTGQGAHIAADATYPTAVADATDLTSVEALLNDIKSNYNSHRAVASIHATADSTNTVTAADATTQGSANTLANEIKAKLNLHFAGAFTAPALDVVAA